LGLRRTFEMGSKGYRMKVLIGGKGGSGKSCLTAMLARCMQGKGYNVLVLDADESNYGLHRLLGAPAPDHLLGSLGGRPAVRDRMQAGLGQGRDDDRFFNGMTIADLPAECITEADGIRLMPVGKIESFGEGCACMIGNLSKTVLARLDEGSRGIVLVDAEAGVEHFGRRVDAACDLILGVVDPTYESFVMADRMRHLAKGAGVPLRFVLNKVTPEVDAAMASHFDGRQVIGRLASDPEVFRCALEGRPLASAADGIEAVAGFLADYRKPVRLSMMG